MLRLCDIMQDHLHLRTFPPLFDCLEHSPTGEDEMSNLFDEYYCGSMLTRVTCKHIRASCNLLCMRSWHTGS